MTCLVCGRPLTDSRDDQGAAASPVDIDAPFPQEADTPEVTGDASPSQAGAPFNRREVVAVAVALLAGGSVTFALMVGTGSGAVEGPASSHRPVADRPAPSARASDRPAPMWRRSREWVGRRADVAFELYAEAKVPVWQRRAHPVLVVRCAGRKPEAFVFIESAARIEAQDERHTVRLRFDAEPAVTERWADSEDHDALFAPDGAAFVRQLVAARRLEFEFTPHNAAAAVAVFPVAGLAGLLSPAARSCGLKPPLPRR